MAADGVTVSEVVVSSRGTQAPSWFAIDSTAVARRAASAEDRRLRRDLKHPSDTGQSKLLFGLGHSPPLPPSAQPQSPTCRTVGVQGVPQCHPSNRYPRLQALLDHLRLEFSAVSAPTPPPPPPPKQVQSLCVHVSTHAYRTQGSQIGSPASRCHGWTYMGAPVSQASSSLLHSGRDCTRSWQLILCVFDERRHPLSDVGDSLRHHQTVLSKEAPD